MSASPTAEPALTSAWAWSAVLPPVLLSLQVACVCLAVVGPPGIALGWLLARRRFRGRALLSAVLHVPLVVPPVAVGYGLLLLLGRGGPVGGWLHRYLGVDVAFTWWAAVVASSVMALPLVVRGTQAAFAAADPDLEAAARTLGATPWQVWWTITLPLAWPGLVSGLVLGFARSLGEFGATVMVAGNIPGVTQTLPLAIYTSVQRPGGETAAAWLVGCSVVLALLALGVSEWGARRGVRTA